MGIRRARPILSCVLAFAVSACAAAPPAGDAAGRSEASLGARLAEAVERGYARRDAESLLAWYAADAVIVTRLYAQLDPAGFRAVLERDLATLGEVQVNVSAQEVSQGDGEATVALKLRMQGTRSDGRPVDRDEVYYYRLARRDAGWRIVRQSFRPDLGAGAGPPPGHPAGPRPPAGHPVSPQP